MRPIHTRAEANKYRKSLVKVLLCTFLTFMTGIALGLIFHNVIIIIAMVVIIGICSAIGGVYWTHYIIWDTGAIGEEVVAKCLVQITGIYHVINDIKIPGGGNIDHIVLTKGGIYVIETKNVNGNITCNGDNWERIKIGRQGTPYTAYIGSPSKQVKGNALFISKFIQSHSREIFNKLNVRIWVAAILVFANDEANIALFNPTVPVLRLNELSNYIETSSAKYLYTNDELSIILKIIEKELVQTSL